MVRSFDGLSLFNPIAYRIFEEKSARFGRPKKFWSFALKTLGTNFKNQFLIFYTSHNSTLCKNVQNKTYSAGPGI
jgi:hypothetical protein